MGKTITDKICRVIGFASYCMLVAFAGMFAILSASALICAIIEKCIVSAIGCVAAGFIAWTIWSIRKDVLS